MRYSPCCRTHTLYYEWSIKNCRDYQNISKRFEDRIPAAASYSAPVQTGPVAHPASYTTVTRSFSGGKLPKFVFDHPPAPRAEVKERGTIHVTPSGT